MIDVPGVLGTPLTPVAVFRLAPPSFEAARGLLAQVSIELGGRALRLPRGVAGLPAGVPGLPFLRLPGRGRIAP